MAEPWFDAPEVEGAPWESAPIIDDRDQYRERAQEVFGQYADFGGPTDFDREEFEALKKNRPLMWRQAEQQRVQDFAAQRMEGMSPTSKNALAVAAGVGQTVLPPLIRPFSPETSDTLNRIAGAYETEAAKDDKSFVPRVVRGTAKSLPSMIAAGGLGGPGAAIAAAMAQEGDSSLTEGRDAGLSESEARRYALDQAAIEGSVAGAFQLVGLGGAESAVAGKAISGGVREALKQAGYRTLQELPEELITELGHNVVRKLDGVDPTAMDQEQLGRMALDTTAQTLLTMGLVESPAVANHAGTITKRLGQRFDAHTGGGDPAGLGATAEEIQARAGQGSIPPELTDRFNQLEAEYRSRQEPKPEESPEAAPNPEAQNPEEAPKSELELETPDNQPPESGTVAELLSGAKLSPKRRLGQRAGDIVSSVSPGEAFGSVPDAPVGSETATGVPDSPEALAQFHGVASGELDPSDADLLSPEQRKAAIGEKLALNKRRLFERPKIAAGGEGGFSSAVEDLARRRELGLPLFAGEGPLSEADLADREDPLYTTPPTNPVQAGTLQDFVRRRLGDKAAQPSVEQPAATSEQVQAINGRQAEIDQLKTENRAALASPMMSEGAISPMQVGMMSKRQRDKWQANVQKRMDVEAQIKDLQRTDEQIKADEEAAQQRELDKVRQQAENRYNTLQSHAARDFAGLPGKKKLRAEFTALAEQLGKPGLPPKKKLDKSPELEPVVEKPKFQKPSEVRTATAKTGENLTSGDYSTGAIELDDDPLGRGADRTDVLKAGEKVGKIWHAPGKYEAGDWHGQLNLNWGAKSDEYSTYHTQGPFKTAIEALESVAKKAEEAAQQLEAKADDNKDFRSKWTNPGKVKKGDFVEVQGENRPWGAVALVDEMPDSGNVLIRNQNGIQRTAHASEFTDRWEGGAIAAGPKAHKNDPALLQAGKKQKQLDFDPDILQVVTKRKLGGKKITKTDVQRAFPQAKMEPIEDGWRVYVGQSYIDVQVLNDIAVNWDLVESNLGRKVPSKMRQQIAAAGRFATKLEDGTAHDGLGLVQLAEKLADSGTARHEALHVARKSGLLTEPEWQALKDKYGKPGMSDELVEEQVAQHRETWKDDRSTWQKIGDFIHRLLSIVNLSKPQARDVMSLLDDGGFWQRKGKPAKDGAQYSLTNPPKWHLKSRPLVEEKMAAKATPQQVLAMLQKNGVKEEELQWTGLAELLGGEKGLKSVTKEQVLAALDSSIQVDEVVKSADPKPLKWEGNSAFTADSTKAVKTLVNRVEALPNGMFRLAYDDGQRAYHTLEEAKAKAGEFYGNSAKPDTKFSQWQIPGGDNYKEMLLTLPGDEYHSSHFDEPNIVAHLRFNERTDTDGKKVMFLEEVQSDWHQEGRSKGYRRPVDLSGKYIVFDANDNAVGSEDYPDAAKAKAEEVGGSWSDKSQMRVDQIERYRLKGVPEAPFKKTWPVLAVKRAIQYAAENGFDRIAWTTGEQQAERYDLSKQVKSVAYRPDGGWLYANGTNGDTIIAKENVKPEELPDIIGKEAAQKLLATERNSDNQHRLEGDSLKIGGEGMKAFYDSILPNEVGKFVKKFGTSVGKTGIDTGSNSSGWDSVDTGVGNPKKGVVQVHAFDVTQAMRDSALENGQPMYSLVGRPDLANPGETQPVRDVVDQVDEERNQTGQPEGTTREAVQQEATQRLEADYQGERSKLLKTGRAGQMLDAAGTIAAKQIINREALEALKSGDHEALRASMDLIDAYRRTGSAQAVAFSSRFDPVEGPAERMRRQVIEAVLHPGEKVKKQIDKANKEGKSAEVERLQKEWLEKFDALKKKLLSMGVDLDNLNELGYDKIKAAEAISIIQTAKADGWDMAYEYWRNSILSGIKTQSANTLGNFGHSSWKLTAERLLEAGLNKALGNKRGAQLGELPYLYGGILPGLSKAAQNFLLTLRTEMPQLDDQLGREGQFKHETPNVAIPGKLGKMIRLPQRLLLASDDFAKTLFSQMEVGARAYRIANEEGLTGVELQEKIGDLMADIESPAWTEAYDSALDLTFNQKGGEFSQAVKKTLLTGRRSIIGARYFVPFITTPINIFSTAVKMTPLGSFQLAKRMYSNAKAGKSVLEGNTALMATQLLSWAVALALMGNDEDDPFITGSEPGFAKGPRELSQRSIPAQTIRIGQTRYSYARIEPFATSLSLMVDWVNSLKSGNMDRISNTPFRSFVGAVKDKTFLDGVGDLAKALEAENLNHGLGEWASTFAAGWVPNFIRQGSRAADDTLGQRRVWGDGAEWWRMLAKRTGQKMELPVGELPAYDLWGRTIPTSVSPLPNTDFVYRLVVPADAKLENIHPGDRVLLKWNNTNPDSALYPKSLGKSVEIDDKQHYLTDEQYARATKLAGEVASQLVKQEQWPEKPTKADMDRLTELLEAGRSVASQAIKDEIKTGQKKEVDPSEAVTEWRKDEAVKLARVVVSERPSKLTAKEKEKGTTLPQKIKAWQEERAAAQEALKRSPLDQDQIVQEVVAWTKTGFKEPETRREKLSRFRARMGWRRKLGS